MMGVLRYGPDPFQFAELTAPRIERQAPCAAAIVIHGGFWRAKYDLSYIRPLCEALVESGMAVWNLEYRRIGNPGGGWPGTLEDVAAGADHLFSRAAEFRIDAARVIAIGHSAGGHLALWLASQRKLAGTISLAGVADLRRAWELQLSNNVVREFLGGDPDQFPDRYRFASPIERLPLGVPQRLFHGTDDPNVPIEISERYVQAAHLRNDDAELTALEGAGHFEVVDPNKKEFESVRAAAVKLAHPFL
jgi:acetyl esterase/lipase